ncbi:MAG: phosphoadenosine phosphosulfate reductase [Mycobacteriales bacterium]
MGVAVSEQPRLAALAAEANARLDGAHPLDVLRWAADEFGDRLCVASSMGDAVLPHLASRARPGIPVIFLDTGYHFAETIGMRDAVAATLPVTVLSIRPRRTVAEQDADEGPRLFERDPDRCCSLRKVAPLADALAPYTAWAAGLRRDESASRRDIGVVEWDAKRGMVKINPMANWTEDDVQAYIAEHGVLVNPLRYDGYESIGCAPCTARAAAGAGSRAGRWAGTTKTECGLHV